MIVARSMAPALAVVVVGFSAVAAAEPAKGDKEPDVVSYYQHVRPVFVIHCQGCHQPARQGGDFVMTGHADLLKPGSKEGAGIIPGQPDKSAVLTQMLPKDGKPAAMPKGRDPLSAREINLVRKWIAQGAKDDTPASARTALVDMDHPPAYVLPPVITSVAYSPASDLLAVAGYHEILLHRADGSGLVARLVGLSERIQAVAFSPDGKRIAAAGGSPGRFGEIQVWDVNSKKLKLAVTVTADTLYGVSWSPDGSKIAFGGGDNNLRAIDAETGKQVLYQGAHSDWILNTVFSTDGTYVISVSRDRSMKLTELATQRFIDNVTSITPGALKGGLAAVARRPMATKRFVKSPPDPADKLYDELLIGGSDGVPRLYKMHREVKRVIGDDANKIREFAAMPGRVNAVSFSQDGNFFVAGSSFDGTGEARVYQVSDGKIMAKLEAQKGGVFAVAYRPDGKQVATAGFDGVVRLNDPTTGKLIKEFTAVPVIASPTK